jgi:peptide/nickel transport system permease protein
MERSAIGDGLATEQAADLQLPKHYEHRSWAYQFFRALLRNKVTILGLAIILSASLAAALAPLISPSDPVKPNLVTRLAPPGSRAEDGVLHILGTDHLGRDVLSRIIFGIRASMAVALIASLGSAILGTLLGLIAGYSSGLLSDAIMRLADMQLAFPYIVLAITFVALIGTSLKSLIIILVIWGWPAFARVARADTLVTKEKEFITAGRAFGVRPLSLLVRHVLPNIASAPIVIWTFSFARLIIVESALTFLGLGVPPPTPTLGGMVSDGRGYIDSAWWIAAFPGLVIMLIVLGANFVGDALRDALDPTLRTS